MSERFQTLAGDEFAVALAASRPPVVVDIRKPDDFEAGHVPGSLNISVHDLGARRRELPGNVAERILVVGDDRKRTHAAANFLILIGFGDIAVLDGGIAAYTGPLETGPPPDRGPPGPELRVVD